MATKLKSAELQDELVRIATVLEATKRDEAEAHAEIKSLARAAIVPDAKDALAKIKAAEGRLGQAKMTHRRLHDARDQVEADLAQALAEEDQDQRETGAKEATAFAETLPHVFAQCDKRFGEFRRSFSSAIDAVNEARSRGWNVPSQEMLQAKLVRALRTALSLGELRMLDMPPLPPSERCSFASLGEAYVRGILGGAKHAVKPPPPIPQAVKSDAARLPPRGDVGVRFKDDPKEFEIRVPIAR